MELSKTEEGRQVLLEMVNRGDSLALEYLKQYNNPDDVELVRRFIRIMPKTLYRTNTDSVLLQTPQG